MRGRKRDEFSALRSWPNKTAHVVGTLHGFVIAYEIWGKATRMLFVHNGRTYGKNFDKIYSHSWEVRLARRFAQDIVDGVIDA